MRSPIADVDGQGHDSSLLAQDCQTGCDQTSQMTFHVFGILQVTENVKLRLLKILAQKDTLEIARVLSCTINLIEKIISTSRALRNLVS